MTKIVQKHINSKKASAQSTNKVHLPGADKVRKNPLLIDTLVQLYTDPQTKPLQTLTRRAKAKFLSNAINFPLIDLKSPLKKSYWQTWHCTSVLLQEGQKITSQYCNNRWCIVCNRIRTAKMINKYQREQAVWMESKPSRSISQFMNRQRRAG